MNKDQPNDSWNKGTFGPHVWSSLYSTRRQGGLRRWVLWLLSERPLRGSEIIESLAQQSMGWWRPSPGTIYPLLHQLEADKLIARQSDSRYEITSAGLEEIGVKHKEKFTREEAEVSMESIISNLESYIDYLEDEKENITDDYRSKLRKIGERLDKL